MSPRARGTPAGEVPKAVQPCGFSMRLDRQFIGRGSETDVGGGDKLATQVEALREAFDDAADDAYDYFLEQYQRLRCRAPCHKSWSIEVPAAAAGNPVAGFFKGLAEALEAVIFGGLTFRALNRSEESGPLGPTYRVSVTLRCNYTLECTERAEDAKDPDKDALFEGSRRAFEFFLEKAGKEG